MAKYSVTFSCNHTDTVHLVGPTKERERKIAWYEEHALCPECFKAQREAERKALEEQRREESEAATANAEAMGLPDLTGSEKQVAWAVTLRQENLVDKFKAKLKEKGNKEMLNNFIRGGNHAEDLQKRQRNGSGARKISYRI